LERISQTKLQLASSLKELMGKVPFCKITVQNVTNNCGLNRQTFYYHCKDMYELLEWIYQYELLSEITSSKNIGWENQIIQTVRYAKKNKVFIRNTIRSLRKETVEKFLYPFLSKWVSSVLDDVCDQYNVRQEEKDAFTKFFAYAFIDSTIQWISRGMPENEDYIIEKVQIIRDMMAQIPKSHCHENKIKVV
jgi:probable dihydroxyacetone kinase regulator